MATIQTAMGFLFATCTLFKVFIFFCVCVCFFVVVCIKSCMVPDFDNAESLSTKSKCREGLCLSIFELKIPYFSLNGLTKCCTSGVWCLPENSFPSV